MTDHFSSRAIASATTGQRLTFYSLVLFTFILYIAPQYYFTFLLPLRLARLFAILAIVAYLFHRRPLLDLDFETNCLLAIGILALFSIPFSVWPGGSYDLFAELFIKSITIYFVLSNSLPNLRMLKQMLWCIVGFCTFLAFFTLAQFSARGFLPGSNRIIGAASGMAANPNDIALTMALVVPFALSLMMITRSRFAKLFCLAYVLSSTAAIFATFSRAGFLTLIATLLVFFFKELKRHAIKTLLIATVFFLVLVRLSPSGYSTRIASILDPELDPTGSAQARKTAMLSTLPIMLQNPILGVGVGMSGVALYEKGGPLSMNVVHNVYLQMAAELGIPAAILFILMHYRLIRNMRAMQRRPAPRAPSVDLLPIARGLEASLIGFVVAGFFYPVPYHFYFYYIAAFAVAAKKIYLRGG